MKGISIDSILSVLVMLYFLILLKMGKLSRSIISIVLSSNLIGLYIIKKYKKRIPKNYKKLFYVSDIMLHLLPLLFIIFILKINLKKEENDINQIIIYLLIALTYLSMFSPAKTYWITQMSDLDLFYFHFSIYLLILLIYFK